MNSKILALFDSDIEYIGRLYHYLENHKRIAVSIRAFTTEESIRDYMSNNKIDYLVISEDIALDIPSDTKVLILSEERGINKVSRYSSADQIMNKIISFFDIKTVTTYDKSSKTQFIGVYSPVARTKKTTFSMVLGQMLAKKSRVLYLNFESFTGSGFAQCEMNQGNLTDIIFYLNNLKDDFNNKLSESICSINGLDYIYPAKSFLDIQYVTKDKWEELLNLIMEMNEYDYIIMDLSELVQGLFDVFLLKCSIVYTLISNDAIAQNKIFQYEELLREYNYDEVLQKTRKFAIPKLKIIPDQMDRLLYTELPDFVRNKTKGDFNW